jgi:hypothetical protein
MRNLRGWLIFLIVPACLPLLAKDKELTFDERVELVRGLTAEYATAKAFLPRSKKALSVNSDGTYDKKQWEEIGREKGPAARVGDLVQITKITLEDDRIVFEINGGMKGGRKWYDRIQVGVGTRTTPVGSGSYSMAPSGTTIALVFPKRLPSLSSDKVKELLAPVLDFNMRSATEQYVESLPPEIQTAIKEKKAVEGMDKDQVLLALGQPRHKVRETKDGVELEDWIYGTPPGRIVFVTFNGNKVVRVKEDYAGIGGEVAPPLPTPL